MSMSESTDNPVASVPKGWMVPTAFILLGTLWGSSFVWIKVAVEDVSPASLVSLRMMLGAAGMLTFLAITRTRWPWRWSVIGHLAVMGLINAGLPIFLISWGEQYIASGTAAVLNALVPLFSLVIAGFILHTESWTGVRTLGLVTGFCGTVVLASREFGLSSDPLAAVGALAVTIASLSYAAGASYAKFRIHDTPRYVVAGGTLVFAAIYVTAWAMLSDGGISLPSTALTWAALLWLGLLGSFVAYLLFFFLIVHVGATVSTMITYLFPVVGISLGWLFLSETPDITLLFGTALIVLGMALVGLRYDALVSRANRLTGR
jgi:drug/metabolite transporter (DMT)-like permease